eukprot:scaffold6247_cov20-Tisochrysis_lutea.AAC.1
MDGQWEGTRRRHAGSGTLPVNSGEGATLDKTRKEPSAVGLGIEHTTHCSHYPSLISKLHLHDFAAVQQVGHRACRGCGVTRKRRPQGVTACAELLLDLRAQQAQGRPAQYL